MKKILLVITILLFLVGCSPAAAPVAEAPPAEPAEESADTTDDKDSTIAVLEYQVEDLTTKLAELQVENDALKAQMGEAGEAEAPSGFMCEGHETINVRYDNPATAIAILEGWIAGLPRVSELQGTYSTAFWTDVNSRIHTVRYISAVDGLTTTETFLIMFEEGGWQPGVLWMTESCWLDYPN